MKLTAEMQNIQRRANEERQQLQNIVAKIWQKRSYHHLDNLERALPVGRLDR